MNTHSAPFLKLFFGKKLEPKYKEGCRSNSQLIGNTEDHGGYEMTPRRHSIGQMTDDLILQQVNWKGQKKKKRQREDL